MERIDQLAAQRGLQGSDDYLAHGSGAMSRQREGAAARRRGSASAELEAKADW